MALKLGKCRLCLKLGDFYSIFTVDNALQLAEMAMECARVKIYDGDGLPDKVCSECIQKLSSAYIFKQQCERADQELRRNYVPPPGFSISPTPPTRQSSDSAFSNHTDSSNLTKQASSFEEKESPITKTRKRSIDSGDNGSVDTSSDYRPSGSKRVEELRRSQKRPKMQSSNTSQADSDYEDNSASYMAETDSDEPLINNNFNCKRCPRQFTSRRSLANHVRIHEKKDGLEDNIVVEIPQKVEDAPDSEEKLSCNKCGKTFKLKIMLNRHFDGCGKIPAKSPQKELLVSLEPIDGMANRNITCEICTAKFKTVDNLEKHMKVVHAAVLKREKRENPKVPVPCLYCQKMFDDYYAHSLHFNDCPQKDESLPYECPVCKKITSRKTSYFQHLKNMHFEPRSYLLNTSVEAEPEPYHECRMCNKKLPSQDLLIKHLAAHMSNIEDNDIGADNESRTSTIDDSASIQSIQSNTPGCVKCSRCDKEFKYKKALQTHEMKCTEVPIEVKTEPPDKPSTSLLSETTSRWKSESESSQDEDDNTCDICEKQFSYRRLLLHHKKTKHNMSSGHKRAKIYLKDCKVRCMICDLEMKVGDINEHNQTHISKNMKPRNLYTCAECEDTFKSCSALANHIKLIHRLNQKKLEVGVNPSDFCEVVVTKAEPLDWIQSHNDFGEVPGAETKPLVDLSGFTCPICAKKMPTLISLKRHVNWHSNVGNSIEKKYECPVCNESFRFQCHYKIHMRQHYHDTSLDPKHLTCGVCGRVSKHLRAAQAHMNFHKQTRFQNKDYQCSICERVFQHRKVYLSHMAIHYKKGDVVHNTIVGDVLPNTADRNVFDGTHTCHHCGKICDSETSLKHHLIWHTSKTFLYGARHECTICKVKFTNKKRLELHIRSHYEDENGPYKCTICGKGYTDEGYFQRHVKGHNFDHQSHKKRIENFRKDKVKCPICSRFYPDLVKLIRHLRRTHPESKMIKSDPDAPPQTYFSCKLCAKVFLDERRLQHHEEAHLRKPEFFKCKFCGKKTISLKNHRLHIKSHLTQKHLDNPLKCPHCEDTFVKGYDLHHHLRDAHDINETWIAERTEQTLNGPLKDLQCSICMKVLASKGNFERHIDYHNSLRCNYCFDYFSSLRFLEGHLTFSCEKKKLLGDTEVYPKKVKCDICYKAFHVQVKLDCHLRTQHGIKVNREASAGKQEFVCDYCFRVFENEYALTTHKIYHRTVGYYGCIYCNRKFNTLTVYRKHKNHHLSQLNVDNPTKCEHCDETFVAFREMIYHMRDVHGDDKEWVTEPKESIEETCPICHKVFYNLHKHLSYHEENKCKKCGEYFYSMIDFDNHLCTIESDDEGMPHAGTDDAAKYEECKFCFKPITKKNSKIKHDKIHRGSGSISCRFCKLKFKTMDAFNIHAFSHRSRKYNKQPIKCRKCNEKFVKYGPFMKHMKTVHKCMKKMHYRAIVKPEKCIVCGDDFPNLHNHYRAHLLNQCQACRKYFTSYKLFTWHECDKEDADPSKVFTCDANLNELINTYVPKDEKDDEKYYGHSEGEEDEDYVDPQVFADEESQDSKDSKSLHMMVQSPIISDVLSLYKPETNGDVDDDVVNITDDDSVDIEHAPPVVVIDDD
ncbi:zinc finger protein Xfin-like [Trichoplusia ni]|uniref:Zinc finger protein Xfin-like n=1 Tax=Trichoplusia ni TaxID=7111 RepID=A0A7E5VE32_TRINI|nr:zinc finger protein Xfin-like [Trichoplusia ni]XP_026726504.1 zinc finger protein Xfin-like [Trichoplusia ni]XP_026726505.1 zinc finger protein Xfin-like [Trichoplusia ni]